MSSATTTNLRRSRWITWRHREGCNTPCYENQWPDKKRGFSGLASKPVTMVCQCLKLTTTISWFWPQNQGWWFGPQNHRYGFLVWVSKPSERRFIGLRLKTDERMKTVWGYTSTFGDLLRCEASRGRVFQFCLKTGKGATAGGACGIIVEVAWKWSERRSVRWHLVQRNRSRTKLPFIRCNFPSSPQEHSSLLFSLWIDP
jgi:hypothetical protein